MIRKTRNCSPRYKRWSLDDLCLLVEGREHQKYKWRTISEMIPNSTENSCQSRYSILKKDGVVLEIEFDEFIPTSEVQDAAFCNAFRASQEMAI